MQGDEEPVVCRAILPLTQFMSGILMLDEINNFAELF
jgi:hypothetical protein